MSFTLPKAGGPSHLKSLDYSIVQQCMHCGLCLPTCPTYDATRIERHSPRGRVSLMRAIADDRLELTRTFAEEMYFCLGCNRHGYDGSLHALREHSVEERMDNDKTVNGKRKRAALAVFVLAAVIGAVTLYFYVKYKATHITTDDAFIEGKIHAVAAKIPGTVKAVAVADNRMVTQGELMVEIDPVDYEIRVREASAAVEAEKTKLGEAKARVETVQRQRGELRAIVESAKAQLELHEANFRQAETDLRRAERLYGSQALSRLSLPTAALRLVGSSLAARRGRLEPVGQRRWGAPRSWRAHRERLGLSVFS